MSTIYGQDIRSSAQVFGGTQLAALAEKYEGLVRDVDGVPTIVRTCRGCKVEVLFPCAAPRPEGWHPPLADPEGGWVPPVALQFLRSVVCEPCAAREELEAARALGRAERQRRVDASDVPPTLRAATWETLWVEGKDQDETAKRVAAIERVKAWSSEPRPSSGVMLVGEPGSGKTWLAGVAAMARLEHSPIRWVNVAVLVAQLDGAWDDEERKKALKVLTEPGAAVLDDLDKPAPTAKARTMIFAALDRRAQAGTTLLVTTNLGVRALEEKWGDPIVSRLVGACGGPLRYPGPDRRIEMARGAR